MELGTEVKVDIFNDGDIVDVIGTSKGKGYNGITSRQGKILKGTIMAGQEGGYRTTNQNLQIVKVDVENNCLLIKGNVPGPKRGMVMVCSAKCAKKAKPAPTLVQYNRSEEE